MKDPRFQHQPLPVKAYRCRWLVLAYVSFLFWDLPKWACKGMPRSLWYENGRLEEDSRLRTLELLWAVRVGKAHERMEWFVSFDEILSDYEEGS